MTLFFLLAACSIYDTACGDVGRAIADRTAACEGSSSMGIGRADALQYTHECPADGWWDIRGMPRGCARAIDALDCDTVRENGNDLGAWLSASSACDDLQPYDVFTATEADADADTDTDTDTDTEEVLPCSEDLGGYTDLTITNNSDTAVDIFWYAGDCTEYIYETLAIGESYVQGTYVGHVWVARELTGARALVDYTQADAEGTDDWSVTR